MNTPKPSPISIRMISLREIAFTLTNIEIVDSDLLAENVNIDVSIEEQSTISVLSTVRIVVLDTESNRLPFNANLTYQIEARITDEESRDSLLQFARFGAAFNALVHAREAISSLTSRSIGKCMLLPLLDVREIGKLLKVNQSSNPEPSDQTEDQ